MLIRNVAVTIERVTVGRDTIEIAGVSASGPDAEQLVESFRGMLDALVAARRSVLPDEDADPHLVEPSPAPDTDPAAGRPGPLPQPGYSPVDPEDLRTSSPEPMLYTPVRAEPAAGPLRTGDAFGYGPANPE